MQVPIERFPGLESHWGEAGDGVFPDQPGGNMIVAVHADFAEEPIIEHEKWDFSEIPPTRIDCYLVEIKEWLADIVPDLSWSVCHRAAVKTLE